MFVLVLVAFGIAVARFFADGKWSDEFRFRIFMRPVVSARKLNADVKIVEFSSFVCSLSVKWFSIRSYDDVFLVGLSFCNVRLFVL